jgi:hypothetical protein
MYNDVCAWLLCSTCYVFLFVFRSNGGCTTDLCCGDRRVALVRVACASSSGATQ